jgi:hypothetical protein
VRICSKRHPPLRPFGVSGGRYSKWPRRDSNARPLLRSRPMPATVSARRRNSLGKHVCAACVGSFITRNVTAVGRCPSRVPSKALMIQSRYRWGQRLKRNCPDTVTYRASVPASLPRDAPFCPGETAAETVAVAVALARRRLWL